MLCTVLDTRLTRYGRRRRGGKNLDLNGDFDDRTVHVPPPRQCTQGEDEDEDVEDEDNVPVLPGYFHMLTLMAMSVFCRSRRPRIDAILMEVGMGGRFDVTNIFEHGYEEEDEEDDDADHDRRR